MRTLADADNKKAKMVLKITKDSAKMLSAILIGNNIVNLSASGIATGIITFLILIFGEVSPKTLSTIKADSISMKIAGIINVLMIVLTPVIFLINKLSLGVLFLFGVKASDGNRVMTEEELRTIVDVGQETGVIEDEERAMIHNVFDFGDAEAKEVMIPRIDMTFVHIDADYNEVLKIYKQDMFTRLPVYEESTDNVVGIINMKDLLLIENTDNFSIRDIMREPYFTYEHKNTSDLFLEMKKSSISLAIVLDEYGVTAGLITLEDLIEEIVGEIRDEYDTDEIDDITRLSDREYLVLGSANLEDVSDELNLHLESDDYDTIGGYCLEKLDHLPERNEIIITDDDVLLRIEAVDKNRIEKVYIKLPEPSAED